jgi:hypothetical protein
MVQVGDLSATENEPTSESPGDAAQAALFADGDVAAGECRWGVTQLGPGADGGDELGLHVTALEPDELAESGAAGNAVDGKPDVALELGQGS